MTTFDRTVYMVSLRSGHAPQQVTDPEDVLSRCDAAELHTLVYHPRTGSDRSPRVVAVSTGDVTDSYVSWPGGRTPLSEIEPDSDAAVIPRFDLTGGLSPMDSDNPAEYAATSGKPVTLVRGEGLSPEQVAGKILLAVGTAEARRGARAALPSFLVIDVPAEGVRVSGDMLIFREDDGRETSLATADTIFYIIG